jgi:hypothetical protein
LGWLVTVAIMAITKITTRNSIRVKAHNWFGKVTEKTASYEDATDVLEKPPTEILSANGNESDEDQAAMQRGGGTGG